MAIVEAPKPYRLTPVKELPPSKRLKHSLYDDILDDALANPERLMKIEVTGKTAKSMYTSFKSRIRKGNWPIKVRVRDKEVYLEKTY